VRPSLFAFAGGEEAILALARAHHARCLADPELSHPFARDDLHPAHVERLAAYWGEVLGGPATYSERCGNHSTMLRTHPGNGDVSDLGRRFVACFVQAADDAGLPEDAEFRAALRAYMVWAVQDHLSFPAPDDVPDGAAMPRWSWDGLQTPVASD